jgi:pSer/pThr/pTyr-binding forkhead associated (FHA) protein
MQARQGLKIKLTGFRPERLASYWNWLLMQVKLIVKKGSTRARVVHLQSAETIIGRRQDCDLRILSSQVSRRHCLLSFHDGVLSVQDLDSVNGTLVNGRHVAGKQALRPGDTLEIGPLRFTVEYERSDAMRSLKGEKTPASDEELEVLPLAEGEESRQPVVLGGEDDELDALPVVDEDTEFLPANPNPVKAEEEDDEAIPLADSLEADGDWSLPPSGDLRSILSEMDEKENKPKKKGK